MRGARAPGQSTGTYVLSCFPPSSNAVTLSDTRHAPTRPRGY